LQSLAISVARREIPNEFRKRSQLFIRSHNEAFNVVAVCVRKEDCSAFEGKVSLKRRRTYGEPQYQYVQTCSPNGAIVELVSLNE
jgi:hypothetical protein